MKPAEHCDFLVVGSGLVGTVAAILFSNLGYSVAVVEKNAPPCIFDVQDGSDERHVIRSSVHLALSERGRTALRLIEGLEEKVISAALPLCGRIVHPSKEKSKPYFQMYGHIGNPDERLFFIKRKTLYEILIARAAQESRIKFLFDVKSFEIDFPNSLVSLYQKNKEEQLSIRYNVLIGADGVNSAVRSLMKSFLLAKNIPMAIYERVCKDMISYREFELKLKMPSSPKENTLQEGYLHLWPRNTFFLMSLIRSGDSHQDVYADLFMPSAVLRELESGNLYENMKTFLKKHFPDFYAICGEEIEKDEYIFAAKDVSRPIKTIYCDIVAHGNVALVGDASHTMVPYYGQGMNAGFEDLLKLYDIFKSTRERGVDHGQDARDRISRELGVFSRQRFVESRAICTMAEGHFGVIAHEKEPPLVNLSMAKFFSTYRLVAFSMIPYSTIYKIALFYAFMQKLQFVLVPFLFAFILCLCVC